MFPHAIYPLALFPQAVFPGAGATTASPQAPYRDLQILDLIRQALDATNEFHEVTLGGLIDTKAESSESLKVADVSIRGFRTMQRWSDPAGVPQERTVAFTLMLLVRESDPVIRLHELDRLYSVAANVINGTSFGGETYTGFTSIDDGDYLAPSGPDQQLKVAGSFRYEVPSWNQFNTSA